MFKKANSYIVTLLATTEDKTLKLIVMFWKAHEMWAKLSVSFEQKTEQKLEHPYPNLFEHKKETTHSIATYISKLHALLTELNEESQRVNGCKLSQTLSLMQILNTLLEEYFDFCTIWDQSPEISIPWNIFLNG